MVCNRLEEGSQVLLLFVHARVQQRIVALFAPIKKARKHTSSSRNTTHTSSTKPQLYATRNHCPAPHGLPTARSWRRRANAWPQAPASPAQGSGFRVESYGLMIMGSGLRVMGSGAVLRFNVLV
jgi:hypothetical protein